MKAPEFWNKKSIMGKVLIPFSFIYDLITKYRIKKIIPHKSNVPVICIGNINVGGVGKTPIALEVAKMLKDAGKNVFFLSRGYKSKLKNVIVSPEHTAIDVGDEPLLLSEVAPVVIAADRIKGAEIAKQNGAEVIIMDDGFQNPYLHKDFSFIVIDGQKGLGNGMIFPAGPLRESLKNGIKRADAVVIMGNDDFNLKHKIKKLKDVPVIDGKIVLKPGEIKQFASQNVIAFSGIANHEKFYTTLSETGARVLGKVNFPDHYNFSKKEIDAIIKQANKLDAITVTTKKDFVRLDRSHQNIVKYLDIDLKFDTEKVKEMLKNVVDI